MDHAGNWYVDPRDGYWYSESVLISGICTEFCSIIWCWYFGISHMSYNVSVLWYWYFSYSNFLFWYLVLVLVFSIFFLIFTAQKSQFFISFGFFFIFFVDSFSFSLIWFDSEVNFWYYTLELLHFGICHLPFAICM